MGEAEESASPPSFAQQLGQKFMSSVFSLPQLGQYLKAIGIFLFALFYHAFIAERCFQNRTLYKTGDGN